MLIRAKNGEEPEPFLKKSAFKNITKPDHSKEEEVSKETTPEQEIDKVIETK